jgi:hypothetical protein
MQRTDPIAVDWKQSEQPRQVGPVILSIGVPTNVQVRRNNDTGFVEIGGEGPGFADLQIADLIGLRDSLTQQINELQANGWEYL